jgi:hypothetical protein
LGLSWELFLPDPGPLVVKNLTISANSGGYKFAGPLGLGFNNNDNLK